MLAHARRTTRGTRYNANQLLGYPREAQAEAGLLAQLSLLKEKSE
jgi:hypothetical protein